MFSNPFQWSEATTSNDRSVVVEVFHRGVRLLLTGDLERDGEAAYCNANNCDVDVVKVGHHGSKTSSTPAFVSQTSAVLAIVSAGRNNRFGHPHASVVKRWECHGTEVMTTQHGVIDLRFEGNGRFHVRQPKHVRRRRNLLKCIE